MNYILILIILIIAIYLYFYFNYFNYTIIDNTQNNTSNTNSNDNLNQIFNYLNEQDILENKSKKYYNNINLLKKYLNTNNDAERCEF